MEHAREEEYFRKLVYIIYSSIQLIYSFIHPFIQIGFIHSCSLIHYFAQVFPYSIKSEKNAPNDK